LEEKDFYSGVYREVQDNGLSGWYIRKSHRNLEKLPKIIKNPVILEVGGNIGEHIKFVSNDFSSYTLTDYRDTGYASCDSRIRFKVADVQHLPFSANNFDRTIATCVLHHVSDPLAALAEMRRVTRVGGLVSILIPCDPGFSYRVAKRIGVSKKWSDSGVKDAKYYHYKQHQNHFPGLDSFISEIFKLDYVAKSAWPLKITSWNMNLFFTYQVTKMRN
jgi:ubiquinone/menaquinone biosynthesis C-methylase UbiE